MEKNVFRHYSFSNYYVHEQITAIRIPDESDKYLLVMDT